MKNPRQPSKRNLTHQAITLKDGTQKNIFHQSKFNLPQYGSFTDWHRLLTKLANPKSKRQKVLRAKQIIASLDIIRRGSVVEEGYEDFGNLIEVDQYSLPNSKSL